MQLSIQSRPVQHGGASVKGIISFNIIWRSSHGSKHHRRRSIRSSTRSKVEILLKVLRKVIRTGTGLKTQTE
jgi:hypothetical protein